MLRFHCINNISMFTSYTRRVCTIEEAELKDRAEQLVVSTGKVRNQVCGNQNIKQINAQKPHVSTFLDKWTHVTAWQCAHTVMEIIASIITASVITVITIIIVSSILYIIYITLFSILGYLDFL